MATKSSENNRLARWSERKLARETEEVPETAARPVQAEPAEAEAPAVLPEDLPDIDSLDAESDFTAFMREGVPEELKNLALRKLWRSDPVYANLDGLNDYDPEHVTFLVQAAEVAKEMLEKALKDDGRDDAVPKTEGDVQGADREVAEEPAGAERVGLAEAAGAAEDRSGVDPAAATEEVPQ